MGGNRIPWIDTCKGLGIFLVVFSHFSAISSINGYLYSFHMPLFFFLSGFLFNSEKYKSYGKFLSRRARSVLVPYFVFFVVTYLSYLLLSRNFGTNSFMEFNIDAPRIYKPIIGLFYSVDVGDYMHFNRPLWFLTCLFVTDNIFYLLQKISPNKIILAVLLFAISIVGYLGYGLLSSRPPWSGDTALNAVAFYGAGYLIMAPTKSLMETAVWKRVLAIIPVFSMSLFFHLLNGRINMAGNVYGNYFYYYPAAFFGIALCILISQWIGKNRVFEYLGRNSLIILCFHFFGSSVARGVVRAFAGIRPRETLNSVPWGIYYLLFSIIFILPIIFIINRYFPFILGKQREDISCNLSR